MATRIREYRSSDEEPVIEFALRAWAPVFASLEEALGAELFALLHHGDGDWRRYQENAIRRILVDPSMHTWVADASPEPLASSPPG